MRKNKPHQAMFLAAFLLFLPVYPLLAFTISIPEDVEKMSPELREKWLENEMKEGYELQKKVARERYDRRLEEKKEVARDMVAEAEKRRARIRDARQAMEKREQDRAYQTKVAYIGISILLVPLALLGLLYLRPTKVSVPETTGRQLDPLKTSRDLMSRLKKKE